MNKLLSLNFPGFPSSPIPSPSGLKPNFVDLASIITVLLEITFYLAAFLSFFWLVWAAFQYILAKGDKEALAKARSRITWAIAGLLIVLMAYLIATYAGEILPPKGGLPFLRV